MESYRTPGSVEADRVEKSAPKLPTKRQMEMVPWFAIASGLAALFVMMFALAFLSEAEIWFGAPLFVAASALAGVFAWCIRVLWLVAGKDG